MGTEQIMTHVRSDRAKKNADEIAKPNQAQAKGTDCVEELLSVFLYPGLPQDLRGVVCAVLDPGGLCTSHPFSVFLARIVVVQPKCER